MNKSKFLVFLLLTAFGVWSASAAIDNKFYNRIADKVWNSSDSIFNASKSIPDSLLENNSAVIIAWSDDIDVDHIVQNSIYTSSGQTNRMKKEHINRMMIKLLDQSAIDKYSDMEFGHHKEIKYRGFILYNLDEAFGARIHKPDGTVVNVSLADAIETGDGKKGNEDKYYKLAIPGLEPGDVLDFFKYSEEMCESYDMGREDVMIASAYPVLSRRVSIATNPAMTVEYKCYNGVPNMQRLSDVKDRQAAVLQLFNVPGVNFRRYVMADRQIPFIRVQFINNVDRTVAARSARRGGLYGNIHTGKILSEFGDYLKEVNYDSPINNRAIKMVKDNFMAAHPDATPREIADAAYLAVNYYDLTGKNESDRAGVFERTLILSDVLAKLNVYPVDSIGVGLVNPRNDVPIDDISAWSEARLVVKTPEALYYMPRQTAVAPGELPGHFKGEKALLYYGNRRDISPKTLIRDYIVPSKRIAENSFVTNDTVTIVDDERLCVTSTLQFTGGIKSHMADFTNSTEWVAEVEDYFDIAPNKRYKDKSYDAVGREKDLKTDLADRFETFYGTKPDSVTQACFVSRGIRPDVTDMKLNVNMEFTGLVEPLGNELSVAIGKIAGMPEPLIDNERRRLLDVMLPCINQENHNILVKKPKGFKFDPASVEALSRNAVGLVGQFFVQPKINDDGDLEITLVMREKFADVPLSYWPDFMNLKDEESNFADASVILVRE